MNRFLILLGLLLFGLCASAEVLDVDYEYNVNMTNFWEKNGKAEQKVLAVGSKIIGANQLGKRIPLQVARRPNVINAFSYRYNKTVVITTGIMPYIDNDDELAYLIGHETAHSLDSYCGLGKWTAMTFNSRQYEYKADLIGLDMMAKAGYNPIAGITLLNKFAPESPIDFGLMTSHPKTSKRILAMYKYIYKKYPWALSSSMAQNVHYVNFTYSAEKDINLFQQTEKERANKRIKESL